MYPILLDPLLSPKPWGGRQLETRLNKILPSGDPIGESWEIFWKNKVSNGEFRGKTLGEVISAHPLEMVGNASAGPEFPLLVKFLDAQEWLSVQVHPDDALAQKLEGEPRGKTECWYVIDAAPGAQIVYGFSEPIDAAGFRKAVDEGRVKNVLQYVTVKAGDFVYMPAGSVHALGPGLLIYELQQTSDTTYRVYDWDRMGLDGKPRELHLEKSLACSHFEVNPPAQIPYTMKPAAAGVEIGHLIVAPYFSLNKLHFQKSAMREKAYAVQSERRAQLLSVVAGRVMLSSPAQKFDPVPLKMGSSAFIPAGLGDYLIEAESDSDVLQGILPAR